MRRKDREMSREFGLDLIDRSEVGILSVTDSTGRPYSVPLSMVRIGEDLFFHSAKAGRKIESFEDGKAVHVVFVGKVQVPDIAGRHGLREKVLRPQTIRLVASSIFTTEFESVMVAGTLYEVREDGQKVEALSALCKKYTPDVMEYFDAAIQASLSHTAVYRVSMEDVTAKRKLVDHEKLQQKINDSEET